MLVLSTTAFVRTKVCRTIYPFGKCIKSNVSIFNSKFILCTYCTYYISVLLLFMGGAAMH